MTKGSPLLASVYVPEQFTLDEKNELAARCSATLMQIAAPVNGRRQLMLVIGEVKDIGAARFGHKMVFKHLPDCPFMVADDLHRRLLKTSAVELGLWEAVEHSHLIAIGTFGVSPGGVASLEQVALMVTTPNWIPFETIFDKTLIDSLMASRRSFRKSLRYNMSKAKPLATLVITDTDPATACYVVAPGATPEHHQDLTTFHQSQRPRCVDVERGLQPTDPTHNCKIRPSDSRMHFRLDASAGFRQRGHSRVRTGGDFAAGQPAHQVPATWRPSRWSYPGR